MNLAKGTKRISHVSVADDLVGVVHSIKVGKNHQAISAAGPFDVQLLPLLTTFQPDLVPLGLQVTIHVNNKNLIFMSDDDVASQEGVTVHFEEAHRPSVLRMLCPFDGKEISSGDEATWTCRTQVAGKLISLFVLKENDVEVTVGDGEGNTDGGYKLTALGRGESIPPRKAPKYEVSELVKIAVKNRSLDRVISPTSIVGVFELAR